MNNIEFSDLVKESFEDKSRSTFLKRVKLVDMQEDDFPKRAGTVFITDIVEGEGQLTGKFEFVATNVPHIKCGASLKNPSNSRLKDIANSLGKACNLRLSELVVAFMVGHSSRLGFRVESGVSKDLRVTADLSLDAVADKVKFLSETFNPKYDRATFSSSLLKNLTNETGIIQAKKVFKIATGLKVDINDTYFMEGGGNFKESVIVPTIPLGTIILSNSKIDNSDIFYLVNLPVTELQDDKNTFGVIGYTTDRHAWSIIKAIPVLSDPTAFATITCNEI